MTETNTKITDEELLKRIAESNLQERQKKDLVGLITNMTSDERLQLLALIDESNKAAKEENAKLGELNKEYSDKLKTTTHKETEYARKEFEKFDTDKNAREIKSFENEISETAKSKNQLSAEESARLKLGKAKKHTLRNTALTLIVLGALTIGIIYGINYLNTL